MRVSPLIQAVRKIGKSIETGENVGFGSDIDENPLTNRPLLRETVLPCGLGHGKRQGVSARLLRR